MRAERPMTTVTWAEVRGKRAVVRAPAGSAAARQAPATLREAERTLAALETLLGPVMAARLSGVQISLLDPVIEGSLPDEDTPGGQRSVAARDELRGAALIRVVRPDAPAAPLALPLTHLILADASQAPPRIVAGVAGVIAAGIGAGPTVAEANDWVRTQLAAGRSVSVLTGAEPAGAGTDLAATAFVAFLLGIAGADGLRQFLATDDPARRDEAAITAFHHPLGVLEEAWRSRVRRPPGAGAFRTLVRQLGPLLRPYWRRELGVLGLMLLSMSYTLGIPLAVKYLVDTLIPRRNLRDLALFVLVVLVVYALNAVILTRRAYLSKWINEHVLTDLQSQLFAHLQRLSHGFYGRAHAGDLLARFASDLEPVRQALNQVAGYGPYFALSALAAGITLVVLNPLLGALVIAILPLFTLSYLLLGRRLEHASHQSQHQTGETAAIVAENLAAHPVIKIFRLEQRAIARYRAHVQAQRAATLQVAFIGALFDVTSALGAVFGRIIVLGVGGYLAITGHLTVGTLVAFINLVPSLYLPVAELSDVGQTVQKASGAMARIGELLTEPVEVADAPGATPLPPLSREIRLNGVTFGYDPDRPILTDVDLAIPAGTHVAVVGSSGSGKSTLVNLLVRFWDPQEGSIQFDGHDLRDVTLASLRDQIGLVFQETFIFDTTIRENIAIGRLGASDAQIARAARAARLDEYIASLPAGYDTVLGERGVRMSGGQRQRLAIARAFLRDPRLLILDEATSALDAQTEREILVTLGEVARGRTTISVTHRLALAAAADQVVVLDHGQVVEQGPHARLVQAGGRYQRLYAEQTRPDVARAAAQEPVPLGPLAAQLRASGLSEGEVQAALAAIEVERGGQFLPRAVEPSHLRAMPLFANLDPAALTHLAGCVERKRYEAGEDVVRQGDPGSRLYLIAQGQADVLVQDGQRERRINTLAAGDYFGELALLRGEPRTATVRTTQPSELYALDRSDFLALLAHEPALRDVITAAMAERRAALHSALADTGVITSPP